jgi:acyl carrier protein
MTHSKSEVIDAVREIFAGTLRVPLADVHPAALIIEDLQVDSLFLSQLAIALEEKFTIQIDEDEMSSVRTVQDVADHIAGKISAA